MTRIEEPPYGICFQCGKACHLGKKLSLSLLMTVYCLNWPCNSKRKTTAELCQGQERSRRLSHICACPHLCDGKSQSFLLWFIISCKLLIQGDWLLFLNIY
ncbi:hypothetical protein LEMLEM_LOCUS16295 [Lemmus lemmus]